MATVQLNIGPTGEGTVLLDGVDISRGVRGVTVCTSIGDTTQVELDLAVHEALTIDSEQATVLIPEQTRETLVALGWTPPAG